MKKKFFYILLIVIPSLTLLSSGCNKDNTPPVIEIIGDNPLVHPKGIPYDDPGATASDDEDGDITDKIQTQINVDINVQAYNYSVTYKVEDEAGNQSQAVRTVHVLEL